MKLLKSWKVKGFAQAVMSRMPGGMRLNDMLQRRVGGLREFEANVASKVGDWVGIMKHLSAAGRGRVEGWTLVEIGSGWYPTLPVCFALAGARRILTADLTRHMNEDLTLRMMRALAGQVERIAETAQADPAEVRERYGRMAGCGSLRELLETAGIEYLAPCDASRLVWVADGTVDLVYSNSVMEHVAPEAIPGLMREAWRVLGPEGLMMHAVACNDHYAHFDRGISFVNYLQFTEREWRFWNNGLNYQNRLRAPEFPRLARECGFRVVHESRAVRAGTREALAAMKVAPEFSKYTLEELAATSVDFVAAKKEF